MPVLTLTPDSCGPDTLQPAVDWLRGGGIVAMPTDTFYGLAVDPSSEVAVSALFRLKGRTSGMALPLVAASVEQVERACGRLPAASRRLAEVFWPGPLSLIADAPRSIATAVHGGRGTVAVRVPKHAVTMALTAAWGGLLTATSANRSGAQAGSSAADLVDLSAEDALLIVDAGLSGGSAPSTIVDVRHAVPTLLREGAIAWDRVLKSLKT